MNVTAPNTVAMNTLPLLVALVQARKQAKWQWQNCADEHKHRWTQVLVVLDARIATGEGLLGSLLDTPGFRVKRVIVE